MISLQNSSPGDALPTMSELTPMEEFFCHASIGETVSDLIGNCY